MTRGTTEEYTEAVQGRYLKAMKKEKGRILDQFIQVSGCHRKATIRLLHRNGSPGKGNRRGRQRRYGSEVVAALRQTWELVPRRCTDRHVSPNVATQLYCTPKPRYSKSRCYE